MDKALGDVVVLKIAFDIDNTITACPGFFSFLSHAVKNAGGKVFVVSSRGDVPEALTQTEKELNDLDIVYDELYHIPWDRKIVDENCPYQNLDWYQRYVLQKALFCMYHKVDIYFDDEDKVIELFQAYAPGIQVFKPIEKEIFEEETGK